jgi:cation:H+ antiporter
MAGGLAGLIIGGEFTVRGATGLAESWGMSEQFVGLTIVAVGTSLPEFATSAVAAYRRNADIAIGNVVGSNIFNIFFVLGLPSLIWPIAFDGRANFDLIVMNLATFALFASMFIGTPRKTVQRAEGLLFSMLYLAYVAYTVYRG